MFSKGIFPRGTLVYHMVNFRSCPNWRYFQMTMYCASIIGICLYKCKTAFSVLYDLNLHSTHQQHKPVTSLFTKQQIYRLVQLESICRGQYKAIPNIEICLQNGRKHCGKRRKTLVSSIFSFCHNVTKMPLNSGLLKVENCAVKS